MFDIRKWVDGLHAAEDTKILLKELIKRKDEEQDLKARRLYLSIINAFIVTMVVFWFFKFQRGSSAGIFTIIDYFASSRLAMIFIFVSITMFIYGAYVSREYNKKKDKYDNLREETARKLAATWKISEDSKMKDEISHILKTYKDINIRYLK